MNETLCTFFYDIGEPRTSGLKLKRPYRRYILAYSCTVLWVVNYVTERSLQQGFKFTGAGAGVAKLDIFETKIAAQPPVTVSALDLQDLTGSRCARLTKLFGVLCT